MERDTSGLHYLFDVHAVRCDDRITRANRAFYHRHIHDIVVPCSADQDAYLPSLIFSHLLDIANRQKPGDIGLL